MWVPADVEQAIADHPHEAADALAAVQLDSKAPLTDVAGIKLASQLLHRSVEKVWVQTLADRQLLETFVLALAGRGVAIDVTPVPLEETNMTPEAVREFGALSKACACRIYKDNHFSGSGVLVGPTTVLTAWHVIGRGSPDGPQEPHPRIEVQLPNRTRLRASQPAMYSSPCTVREFQNLFPESDDEVRNSHDVAVLRLARPAGAALAVARLPDSPSKFMRNAAVMVVHFPGGKPIQIGSGSLQRLGKITARWGYTSGTDQGSSGGACFDTRLRLLGIHQGRGPENSGRLVPASRFLDKLRSIVASDVAPPAMWSLDGTPDGEFVIGRERFFQAFAAARRNQQVRGIRIRRVNAAGDLSGLPFTFHMLEQLVARSPDLRLVRVSFETLTADIADEIARRAADAGFDVGPIISSPGVAEGQSAPEAVGADRGRRAAALINQEAEKRHIQLWIFIDHPSITFGDAARSTLEAFIDAVLHLDHLRLAIAGYEAVALPGQDFFDEPPETAIGDPGLMTEMLTGFRRSDVRHLLMQAAAAAGRKVSDERLDELEEEALAGLDHVNGLYEPWMAAEVTSRLREPIRRFFRAPR